MSRVAVFVDAGYFFAQGSVALTGAKREQHHAELDQERLVTALESLAFEKSGHRDLLRIYWYDGVPGPTAQQQNMAGADNVKLRLGLINEYGKQKGVDSLIVTDLAELSRNKAISDAVLLSGDEDVRIGVEIAQGFGVRVHLLGIVPSRGSQARTLLSEADTTTEWNAETVGEFLTFAQSWVSGEATEPSEADGLSFESNPESIFRRVVAELIEGCTGEEISACRDALRRSAQVPQPYDGRLLATSRTHLGRELAGRERSQLREIFRMALEEGIASELAARSGPVDDDSASEGPILETLRGCVDEWVGELTDAQVRELQEFWRHSIGVPPEHDRPLLASCRERIGRDLTPEERRTLRKGFQDSVEKRCGSA